jgi:HSP20 family protein
MPSINYMNNGSAPFWDFLASLEQQDSTRPSFTQNRNGQNEPEHSERREGNQPLNPFEAWGWDNIFGGAGIPHRGPPPPSGPAGSPHRQEENAGEKNDEKNDEKSQEKHDSNDNNDTGEGPSGQSGSDNDGGCPRGWGGHGRCGGRRGRHGPGRHEGFARHHSPHGHHGHHGPRGSRGPRGPPHHGAQGRHGPWGRGPPFGMPFFDNSFDPAALAAHFWERFTDEHPSTNKDTKETGDFTPEADVFDTDAAFVVHIALPGAKKEDVGVNWDTEKSELSIAGVIYRPGDEAFLKTLALNERKVGPFERKIRLGTRANPAQIDADGISAKLEDGVLRVEVPKMDSGFVEVRKVDIE